jgi:hypothetical protein
MPPHTASRVERALNAAARQLIAASQALSVIRAEARTSTTARPAPRRAPASRRAEVLDAETMRAGIFHFLEQAPRTTRELMDAMIESARLQFRDGKQKNNFSIRIAIALRRYEGQGVVRVVGKEPLRWALVRRPKRA